MYDYGVLKIQTEKYYFNTVPRCLKNLSAHVKTTQALLHDWLVFMSKKHQTIQA